MWKRAQSPRVKKETKPTLRRKWECFSVESTRTRFSHDPLVNRTPTQGGYAVFTEKGSSASQMTADQRGTKPSGKRAIAILSILHVLTIGEFCSKLGQVPDAWRKTSSQPTEGLNSTPTNTARTELLITRTRVAQELHS